jgi:hypothetical protein
VSDLRPTNREQFVELAEALRAREGYVEPAAFGIGLATHAAADDAVLDTWFPVVNLGENLGAAAIVADVVGHDGGSGTYELTPDVLSEILHRCAPMVDDGGDHPNLRVLSELAWGARAEPALPVHQRPVVTFIGDLATAPVDAHDVYLRLHLLSYRKVAPHGLNLDGQFGLLANVVWTTLGPCDVASFEAARTRLRAAGTPVAVTSVDKFPRMLDYVVPTGVRVADGERVRLGAHLAEGTTVMHEGFVNFNAGTLGSSMVEGRISAACRRRRLGRGRRLVDHGHAVRWRQGDHPGGGAVPHRRQRRHRHLPRGPLHRGSRALRDRRDDRDPPRRHDGEGQGAQRLTGPAVPSQLHHGHRRGPAPLGHVGRGAEHRPARQLTGSGGVQPSVRACGAP